MGSATGFIVGGVAALPQAFIDAGITVRNWRDDPSLRLVIGSGGDGTARRTSRIRGIVIHTTQGKWPQAIKLGVSPAGTGGEANARYWSRAASQAGAHLIVDTGQEILQTCDLLTEAAYHAGGVNDVTVGIEIVQASDGSLWEDQLTATVLLCDYLTKQFQIQRQIPAPYKQNTPCPRLMAGGRDFFGVYGHRDQTTDRGRGDPGDTIMQRLNAAGYEIVDVLHDADKDLWRSRQAHLNTANNAGITVDGEPGTQTCNALRAVYGNPLWVPRPIDGAV